MKKALFSAAAVSALISCPAFADRLSQTRSETQIPAWSSSWQGFYAGLNAGYSLSGNNSYQSQNVGPNWSHNPNSGKFGNIALAPSIGLWTMAGAGTINQAGVIGGLQIGYNHKVNPNIIIGLETDIQATGIHGGRSAQNGVVGSLSGLPNDYVTDSTSLGSNQFGTGVSYLGTVRGRLGYLITQDVLLFGTGGLTYGEAYSNMSQSAVENVTYNYGSPPIPQGYSTNIWSGNGQQSQLLTGWNAGGGVEWMFKDSWTFKVEAIYWDIGKISKDTTAYGISGNTDNSDYLSTLNNFGINHFITSNNGIIIRAGLNYHLHLDAL